MRETAEQETLTTETNPQSAAEKNPPADLSAIASKRDLSVDLMRTLCLLAVIAVHVSMTGVGFRNGGIVVEDPLTRLSFFQVGSWAGQVMPFFFLLGGFSTFHAMSSLERRQGKFADFLRVRVLRMGQSAALFYFVMSAIFSIVYSMGLPADLVNQAMRGAGLILWFMAAYLICQGFVRVQYKLVMRSTRAQAFSYAALILFVALCLDGLRYMKIESSPVFTGNQEVFGLVNMWVVWPLMQLLGMMLARGFFDGISKPVWLIVAALAFCLTAVLGTWGPYSPDMLTNLNPPTVPQVSIGVMQLALFQCVRQWLRRLAQKRPAQMLIVAIGGRSMNVYLWHLCLMIGLNGLLLFIPGLPEPGSAMWWISRIPVFLLSLAVTLAVVWKLDSLERVSLGARVPTWLVWVALYLLIIPDFVVMRIGLNLWLGWIGVLMICAGVLLARPTWLESLFSSRGEKSRDSLPHTP